MKLVIMLCAMIMVGCAGCMSVEVQTAKPYEGHFMTVDEFKAATDGIKLENGESVWVLSNSTLKRLLKNSNGK